jgi:Na+(H+)/acetate symporter ActP
VVGGGAAVGSVLLTVLARPVGHGWVGALLAQPAAWTVPLAFAVMVVVSLCTRKRVPGSVGATMLRLHAPDALRL